MPVTVTRHRGSWDASTRQVLPLKYLEDYISEVTSDFTLPYPNTKYYTPRATFHDNGVTYHGADDIKGMMKRVFGQFEKIVMEPRFFQVIDESEAVARKYTVIAELMVSYYPKGDPEPVLAPRLMVFSIVDGVDEEAYEGLNFEEVYLGWNTGVVKEEIVKRAKHHEDQ